MKRALRSVSLTCFTPCICGWHWPVSHLYILSHKILFEGALGSYLHLNIENTYSALLCDVLHRLNTGAVVVSSKLRMLDESVLAHEIQKVFLGRVVIFASMLLTWSRSPRSIYVYLSMPFRKTYDQLERWEGEGNTREIENPKVSGNSAKSRFNRVDLPAPDGPDTTTGRNFCTVFGQLDGCVVVLFCDNESLGEAVPALVAIVEA